MTTHRCTDPTLVDAQLAAQDAVRAHINDMALAAVDAPDDQRCASPTCPGSRVISHLRTSHSDYLVLVAGVALRLLGETHRDGAAALVETAIRAARDGARPACSCCQRRVGPLTDGICGLCDNRCADLDDGCILRMPPSPPSGEAS